MTTRQFVSTKGDTWEWEETEETRKAVENSTNLSLLVTTKVHSMLHILNSNDPMNQNERL